MSPDATTPDATTAGLTRRTLLGETALVLGVSLGASAIWSVLSIIRKATAEVALSAQTTAMNSSVTPDRPWLDLAYQLTGIALGTIAALVIFHVMNQLGRVTGTEVESEPAEVVEPTPHG